MLFVHASLVLSLPAPATFRPQLHVHRVRGVALVADVYKDALTLGDPWWEADQDELSRPPAPGKSRYLAATAAIGVVSVGSLLASTHNGALRWTATAADVASSPLLPWWSFALWRVFATLGVSALSVRHYCTETLGVIEDLDRRGRLFRYRGFWRFQGLTGVSWLLLNAYFVLATVLTLRPSTATRVSSVAACAAQVLMSTSWALALLVTTVVTFWLIPARVSANLSVDEYYNFNALVMHNANVWLMGIDVWLSTVKVDLLQLPIATIVGVLYIFWHQSLRYARTRTLLYHFLNWSKPGALRALFGLTAAFSGASPPRCA